MIRESSGSSKRRVDINQTTQEYASKYTLLEYYESKATNPPDILRVYQLESDEYKDYTIEKGFKIKMEPGTEHSVISSDPSSYRKFTATDSRNMDVGVESDIVSTTCPKYVSDLTYVYALGEPLIIDQSTSPVLNSTTGNYKQVLQAVGSFLTLMNL